MDFQTPPQCWISGQNSIWAHILELTLIQPASRVHKLYQRLWVGKWTKSCSHSSTSCTQLSKFRRRPHLAHHISVTNTTRVGITHSAGILPSSSPNYKCSAIYTLGSQREVVIMAKDIQRDHGFLNSQRFSCTAALYWCPAPSTCRRNYAPQMLKKQNWEILPYKFQMYKWIPLPTSSLRKHSISPQHVLYKFKGIKQGNCKLHLQSQAECKYASRGKKSAGVLV